MELSLPCCHVSGRLGRMLRWGNRSRIPQWWWLRCRNSHGEEAVRGGVANGGLWPEHRLKEGNTMNESFIPDQTSQQILQLNFKTYLATNEVIAVHINKCKAVVVAIAPTSNVNGRLTPTLLLWKMWECPNDKCALFPRGQEVEMEG